MNALAPPFPTNPSVGEFFGDWVWNGSRWVSTAGTAPRVITQVFHASGPYMPSQGLISCVVECIGGGGGGGFAGPTATVGYILGGGGGGSGGYSRKTLAAALVLGGVAVTIGAGGTAPTGAGQNPVGGVTSFGALCLANGGLAGGGAFVGGAGQGGWGGPPQGAIGDLVMPGSAGFAGSLELIAVGTEFFPGYGGQGGTMWGGNVMGDVVGEGASQAGHGVYPNTGSGGTGGCINQLVVAGTVLGSPGGSGICIVTEYCWADGDDDCVNPPINVNARVAITREPWPGPGPCPADWGQLTYED